MTEEPEFSRALNVESLGEAAKRLRLEADEAERAAVARRFDLLSLDSLVGDLIVDRVADSDLIRVHGRVAATLTQACVVTGKAVEETISEPVDERFGGADASEAEVDLSIDEEDPPEPIVGGEIDLGEIVAQYLGVAMDPYPRAPDAEIPPEYQVEDEDPRESRRNPFEVLSNLSRESD